jgi:hypothetical protein
MQSTMQRNDPSAMARSGPPASSQHLGSYTDQGEDFSQLVSELSSAVRRYCNRRPRVAAGCVFSLGFVLGWKLRPW